MQRLIWIILALLAGVLLTGAVFAYGGHEASTGSGDSIQFVPQHQAGNAVPGAGVQYTLTVSNSDPLATHVIFLTYSQNIPTFAINLLPLPQTAITLAAGSTRPITVGIEIPLEGDFNTAHVLQLRALAAPAGPVSATAMITTMVNTETLVHTPVLLRGDCEDAYEPNDGISSAYPLPPNTTIAAHFCRNGTVGDDPDDFFRLTLSSAGRIDALLTGIPANSDFDLYLYNQAGTTIAGSALSGSPQEHFLTGPLAAGVYYLRVYPYVLGPDAIQPYQLRWTVQ